MDTSKVKIGDKVHVAAVVESVNGYGNLFIRVDGFTGWVRRPCIVHVEPRPIQVGDTVRVRGEGSRHSGKVVAIYDAYVWVAWLSAGTPGTCRLEHLEHADA